MFSERQSSLLSSGPSSFQSLVGVGLSPRVFLCLVILLICYSMSFYRKPRERGACVAHLSTNCLRRLNKSTLSSLCIPATELFSKTTAIFSKQTYEENLTDKGSGKAKK